MVRNVGYINPILFKAQSQVTNADNRQVQHPQIKELSHVTPDFAVKMPQKYKLTNVKKINNGPTLYSYKLNNGHKITIIPMENSPTTVKNYVNVGSMNETDDIKGISHFLEHMAFNGTNGTNGYMHLKQGDSFKKIDKLGGWTNASTNYAITDYVNSTPLLKDSDLDEQLKVIAAMTEDLALTNEMIEKEKGPVCSEIDMILDDPNTILTDQTVRSTFNIRSSADELVGGSVKHIRNLTREKVKEYYDKYYTPNNMNLVITGDVDPQKTIEKVAKYFNSTKVSNGQPYETQLTPIQETVRKDFVTDKSKSASIMLGFSGPKNNDTKNKIVFEVVSRYLTSAEAGINKNLKEMNYSGFIGMDKIGTNPNSPTFLYYSMDGSDSDSEKALKVIYDKLPNLKPISEDTLARIKEGLIQEYKDGLEHSMFVNNFAGNSILVNDLDYLTEYENIINSLTRDDITNFIKTYLNLNKTALNVMHPKENASNIEKNYLEANKISFKGARKEIINNNKTSINILNNNVLLASHLTQNDNINFSVSLKYKADRTINPAVREVLNEIYSMGSQKANEYEFDKYKEQNNIAISSYLDEDSLTISGYSNTNNFDKASNLAFEVLKTPRINDKTVQKAIERIRDSIMRSEDSAYDLYIEQEALNNPLHTSKKEVLEKLDNVTVDDVINLHENIIKNSNGVVLANIPENNKEFQNTLINKFNQLPKLNKYEHNIEQVYTKTQNPKVLTKAKSTSQADIAQIYKFETNKTPKEYALSKILNTILTSSSEIGLFNTLREKEHLAYSVGSDSSRIGNCGELSCYILTTTDNKDTGEISYDNVQKSINGFHRQINELLNSNYSDDDFESAKNLLKARLLNKESVSSKLGAIHNGIDSDYGPEFLNIVYKEIDNITREDLDNFAKKVFNNPPTYSIVASEDTLNANKDFFKKLEQN